MKLPAEIQGYWFLPSYPDRKVPGLLKLTARKAFTLTLYGALNPTEETARQHSTDTILGIAISGLPITLVHCFQSGGRGNSELGRMSWRYRVFQAYIGKHYVHPENITAQSLEVTFSKPWLWRRQSTGCARLRVKDEPTIDLPVNEDVVLYSNDIMMIKYHERLQSIQHEGEAWFTAEAVFSIESSIGKHIDEYRPLLLAIRSFLSLACRTPIDLRQLSFGPQLGVQEPFVEAVSRFVHAYDKIEVEDEHSSSLDDILFNIDGVMKSCPGAFGKWVKNIDPFMPVYVLYRSGTNISTRTIDTALLNLAQAAEAFYRRAFPGETEEPAEIHAEKVRRILDAVPEEYRKWLSEKLSYSNEISFRKRIRRLVEYGGPKVREKVGRSRAVKDFAKDIYQIRNFYTHYDPRSGYYPFKGELLGRRYTELRLVLEASLLRWLGFSSDEVDRCLSYIWDYQ